MKASRTASRLAWQRRTHVSFLVTAELRREAARLGVTVSGLLQRAWRMSRGLPVVWPRGRR
jgi:hypothetical protein